MINIFSECFKLINFPLKYDSFMGRGVLQCHDNKIPRPSSSFMINKTQLKFRSH